MDAPSIVGRDPELARLRAFVTPPAGGRAVDGAAGRSAAALLLVGEPGLGKTTLWQAGVDLARHERLRVLAARPAEPESRLGFSGLADLLGNLPRTMLASLPPPQRRALEIALVLADATSADTPEERAVGPAVLGVLRAAAARRPILVAIDDLQWLDVASADALAYALRRAGELPVRVLLARRPGAASRLEASAGGVSLDRLDLAPLSPGAIRRVVRERLGLELSHRSLRALHDRSGGSPLAALELARLGGQDIGLDDEPRAARGADLDDVVGLRVERLPKNVRTLLAAVAMAAAPRVAEMELLDRHAYARALQLGALVSDADRVRLGHPLLGAAAVRRASPVERRVLHGRLAAVVEDAGQRLRHRALAAEGPDPGLAAALAAAALAATRRGAHEEAADLADAALRLTPADAAERPRRLLDLVERLLVVGEHDAARRWLDEAVTTFAPGPQRATARVLQGEATYHHAERPDVDLALDLAMQDGADDPRTRAWILARRASYVVLGKVDDLPAAERALREAIHLSRDRFPDVEREALRVLAWAQHLRGESLEPVRARFEAIHGDTDVFRGIDRIQAERWAAEGRLADAHAELER
ncbi:MAG TPA: ATP-binding protein, partial [Candidatus Limnocylindrales bacterium]